MRLKPRHVANYGLFEAEVVCIEKAGRTVSAAESFEHCAVMLGIQDAFNDDNEASLEAREWGPAPSVQC